MSTELFKLRLEENMSFSSWLDLCDFIFQQVTVSFVESVALVSPDALADKIQLIDDNPLIKNLVESWLRKMMIDGTFDKDLNKADVLRKFGNRLFKKRNHQAALNSYNAALRYATEGSHESLATYRNRSLLLLRMNLHKECVSDIDRSLGNCSEEQKLKLMIRKAECFFFLKKRSQAISLLEEACEVLTSSSAETIQDKDGLLRSIEEKKKQYLALTEEDEHTVECSLPEPVAGFNPDLPGASKLIKLGHSEIKGRSVIADTDLQKGDLIICEKPLAFVLLPDYAPYYCHNCCIKPRAPVACGGCNEVVYCGEDCLSHGWLSYHQFECPKGISVCRSVGIAHIALRWALIGLRQPDNTEYLRSLSLVSNIDKWSTNNQFQYALTAYAMAKYMHLSSHWKDVAAVGGKVLLHMMQMIANGQTITDNWHPTSSGELLIANDDDCRIAGGIYPTTCLLNHSCQPNTLHCFMGQFMVVKATRDIARCDEVYNCYGVTCYTADRDDRKKLLLSQYMFDCNCEACTSEIDPFTCFTSWKCPECDGPIPESLTVPCINCNYPPCSSLRQMPLRFSEASEHLISGDQLLENKSLKDALLKYHQAMVIMTLILYRHHKDLMKTRNKISKCYLLAGDYDLSYRWLEESLKSVRFRYGNLSIKVANDLSKLCDLIINKLSVPGYSFSVKDRLLIEKTISYWLEAESIFEEYYGNWCHSYLEKHEKSSILNELKEKIHIHTSSMSNNNS